ncbi:MAG: hypothetical protein AB1542_19010, partial [Pseudomonadota bacterium]
GDTVNRFSFEGLRKDPTLHVHQTLLSSSEKLAWVSTETREDHDCLSSLLDRIASAPPAIAPEQAPPAKDLFETAPFQFRGDTWPKAVALEVVRSAHGLRAQLSLWLRGGDSLVLKFSLTGATMLMEELDGSLAEDHGIKHSSITLPSTIAAKVVACLAGKSSNSDDNDRKAKG